MLQVADFVGKAIPLTDFSLPRQGHRMGVGEDHVHMFLDVETDGKGHDESGRSIILFERHIFYRELKANGTKAQLDEAVSRGLASPRAGGYGKTSEQYGKLFKALKINETAALRSCSWGLGQVMGFNHLAAGFNTVHAMITAFKESEEAQLAGAVNFIMYHKLDKAMRACKPWQPETCRAFAAGYNGSGYARNNYHVKLANALGKWSRIKDTEWSPEMDKPVVVVPPKSSGVVPALAALIVAIAAMLGENTFDFIDKIKDMLP